MITANDFKFNRVEKTDGHEDYWFDVSPNAEQEFFWNYSTQGVEHFFEVVYSKDEDVVGVKRQYRFSWDVVISNDDNLKKILRELSNNINK